MDVPLGPEARYEQAESISLAFVTALQVLPPRQLAVLVLRDVLGFHAGEVADMLDTTAESVNSALKRARASLQRRHGREPAPAPDSLSEQALVVQFTDALEPEYRERMIRESLHRRALPGEAFSSYTVSPQRSSTAATTARSASRCSVRSFGGCPSTC